MHNDLATRMNLAGRDAEYIDTRKEKLHESIKNNHDEDIESLSKSDSGYLEQVSAKHG